MPAAAELRGTRTPRHSATVRVTHWLTVIAFIALVVTGIEIVLSHPRFYWGETGNVNEHPLFTIHVPSSRATVPTGFGYVLPDQNGWSRYLHFEAAWLLVITGSAYLIWGAIKGHFWRTMLPPRGQRNLGAVLHAARNSFRRKSPDDAHSYNALQGITYLFIIFIVFPLMIWTGLAMSPSVTSTVPEFVQWVGGRQSARTIHFFLTGFLLLFLAIHIAMITLAGFVSRMRAMITGRIMGAEERP